MSRAASWSRISEAWLVLAASRHGDKLKLQHEAPFGGWLTWARSPIQDLNPSAGDRSRLGGPDFVSPVRREYPIAASVLDKDPAKSGHASVQRRSCPEA